MGRKLNSVECALLTSEGYDNNFNIATNDISDKLIGPVLYRDEEEIINSDRLYKLLDDYISNNIGKFYNLTILEYVSLPRLDARALNLHARKVMEEREELAKELEGLENKDLEGFL